MPHAMCITHKGMPHAMCTTLSHTWPAVSPRHEYKELLESVLPKEMICDLRHSKGKRMVHMPALAGKRKMPAWN